MKPRTGSLNEVAPRNENIGVGSKKNARPGSASPTWLANSSWKGMSRSRSKVAIAPLPNDGSLIGSKPITCPKPAMRSATARATSCWARRSSGVVQNDWKHARTWGEK